MLIRCPQCRRERFDTWCGSCESRQCGYVFERCTDCPHDLCEQGWRCLRAEPPGYVQLLLDDYGAERFQKDYAAQAAGLLAATEEARRTPSAERSPESASPGSRGGGTHP